MAIEVVASATKQLLETGVAEVAKPVFLPEIQGYVRRLFFSDVETHPFLVQLIQEYFLDQPILWMDLRKEQFEPTLNAAFRLHEGLKPFRDSALNRYGASDNASASMIAVWSSRCRELGTMLAAKVEENKELWPNEDKWKMFNLSDELQQFRKDTLPIISVFVDFLPEGDAVKVAALKKLDVAKLAIGLTPSDVPDPKFSLDVGQ